MNKIQKLTQVIRDYSECDLDFGTIKTLKMIDDESLKLETDQKVREPIDSVLPDGWISVEDRLPKNYGRHLVCLDKNAKRTFGNGIHVAWYYTGTKNWSFSLNSAIIEGKKSSVNVPSLGVTHWQPLPEPPKEER